ncbi:MAG: pyrroline-5-carboxylate reductase [Candidatus Omnitrophota bacterium]
MNKKPTIGILGLGNMGRALAETLSAKTHWRIAAFDEISAKLKKTKNLTVTKNCRELITKSDILIIAIKPQDISEFITTNRTELLKKKPLIISIAAGVPIKFFESQLGNIRVIRTMPNLAAKINESMTFITKGKFAKADDVKIAEALFKTCGKTAAVKESLLNKVTAISGSGPGYVYYLMDCLYKAAGELGFKKAAAYAMVLQTFLGAVKLAKLSGKDFKTIEAEVTSKKGITEAALKVFKKSQVDKIILEGVQKGVKRAEELSLKNSA